MEKVRRQVSEEKKVVLCMLEAPYLGQQRTGLGGPWPQEPLFNARWKRGQSEVSKSSISRSISQAHFLGRDIAFSLQLHFLVYKIRKTIVEPPGRSGWEN